LFHFLLFFFFVADFVGPSTSIPSKDLLVDDDDNTANIFIAPEIKIGKFSLYFILSFR
jgi:hypothetical protein